MSKIRESVVKGDRIIKMDPGFCFGEDEVWLYEVMQYSNRIAFDHKQLYLEDQKRKHYAVREHNS